MMLKQASLVLYVLAITAATFRVATDANIMTLTCYAPGIPSLVVAGSGEGQCNATRVGFGSVNVFDQRFQTETPDPTSKYLGQARGFTVIDALAGTSVLDVFMLDFVNDRFNGSVGFYGTENLLTKARTVPISGGSGDFLFTKGYAVIQTMQPYNGENTDGGVMVASYNITLHYKTAGSLEDF